MKRLLYIAALALTITACSKEAEDTDFITPNEPTTTNVVTSTIVEPTGTPSSTTTTVEPTETATETTTETVSVAPGLAYNHEVVSVHDDGKANVTYSVRILANDEGQTPLAYFNGENYIVLFTGENLVEYSEGQTARVEYSTLQRTTSTGVVIEFSSNGYAADEIVNTVEQSVALQEGNSQTRRIFIVSGDGAAFGGVASASSREYAVANGNHLNLHTYIHEDGHVYDFVNGVNENHGGVLHTLSEMFHISDYGNNNGLYEYFAEIYAFYFTSEIAQELQAFLQGLFN